MSQAQNDVEKRVMEAMHRGIAPSEIDRMLGLEPGTAHDVVIDHWYTDKMSNRRSRC